MTVLAPSLPSFSYLPIRLPVEAISGYLYGTISKGDPVQTMVMFTIRCLAETLFFRIANGALDGKDTYSHKIFIATSSTVNAAFLIVMRELNLIGRLSAAILGLSVLGYLVKRVYYIQADQPLEEALLKGG